MEGLPEKVAERAGGGGEFKRLAGDFACRELLARREIHDRHPFGPLWKDVLDRAALAGFFGVNVPEMLGGAGQGVRAFVELFTELSRADASLAAAIFTTVAANEILNAAAGDMPSDPRSAAGIGGTSIVTFRSGSLLDEGTKPAMKRFGEGSFSISGTVRNVFMAPMASHAVVAASVEGESGPSYFIVPLKKESVQVSDPVFTLGFHACPVADIIFKGAPAFLAGIEGEAAGYHLSMMGPMSVSAAAISLGIMMGSLDEAAAYAGERVQGGRKIIEWQEVRMMLSGMEISVRIAEAAILHSVRLFEASSPDAGRAAVSAALTAGEAACAAASDGVQILGGYGYMKDYGQEKRMRDAWQARILLGNPLMRKLGICGAG